MLRNLNGPNRPAWAYLTSQDVSGRNNASEILQGFGGNPTVDGYAETNRVLDLRDNAPNPWRVCWANARPQALRAEPIITCPITAGRPQADRNTYDRRERSEGKSADERLGDANSKNLRQRSRPSKSGWINARRGGQPNPRRKR